MEFTSTSRRRIRELIYWSAKKTYWLLPSAMRLMLNGIRHDLVRRLKVSAAQKISAHDCSIGDSIWSDFYTHCLNARTNHCEVIIFEPNVDWNIPLFQRPQQMALALSASNNFIVYRTYGDGLQGCRRLRENLWLVNSPLTDSLENCVHIFQSTSPYISIKVMQHAANRGVVIYDYIDKIDRQLSGSQLEASRLLGVREYALSGGANLVVASAAILLLEVLSRMAANRVTYVPNGVDLKHFDGSKFKNLEPSEEMQRFRQRYRFVVGYFGAIAPWLWFDLINDLSKARPDIGFVFIGPDFSGCVEKIHRRENVFVSGPLDYEKLPEIATYLFDIGIIPFRLGEIAKATSPIKLFEYFALEIPVVVTSDLAECTKYSVVFSGANTVQISLAIDLARVASNDGDFKTEIKKLASSNSWIARGLSLELFVNTYRISFSENGVESERM